MTDVAALLDALPDALLVAGPDGRVRWANQAVATLTGLTPGDLLGRALEELFERPPAEGQVRERLLGVPVLVSARPAPGGGRAILVRDLRPWAGLPQARERGDADRNLGAVFQAALSVSGGEFEAEEDYATIAQVLAVAGRRLVPTAECLICLVEPARPGVFAVAGAAGPWAGGIRGREYPLDGSLAGRAISTRAAYETSEARRLSVLGEALAEGDITTARLVPVLVDRPLPDGRTALGTIGFYSSRRSPFSAHQRRLMDDFAGLVRVSLSRASYRRAARLATDRLNMGVSLAIDLGRSLQPREVVGRLLERLVDVVDCERAALLRVDGLETVTEDARDRGGIPDTPGYRHPIAAQPLMAQAVRSGRPVLGGAYQTELVSDELRSALSAIRHTLTVPLVLQGQAVAVLVLSRRRDAAFGPDEVDAVQLAGTIAVLALRNSWLYAEAEDASHQKSDFLNMAAHELRTPFTVVAGYLSMLVEGSFGPIPDAARRPVDTLAAKASELGGLVEDLLIAARLDSGGMPVRREAVDLIEAGRQAVARAAPRAALVQADLQLDAAEACPVIGDPEHLARILDNLVNNALTYSAERPWVRVRVRRAGGYARLEVEDHGQGIAEPHTEHIFERFYRVDDPELPPQPGTGLGLFISGQLAERMGASLVLEWTRPREGSRFVLSLPAMRTATL